MTISIQELDRIAYDAARKATRRTWWADREDAQQDAWVQILEMLPRYRAEMGTVRRFVWLRVLQHICRELWRQSSPVTAGWHNLRDTAGLYRAPVSEHAPAAHVDPDMGLVVDAVFEALEVAASRIRDGAYALPVVLGELDARRAAEVFGVDLGRVRRAATELRRAVSPFREIIDADVEPWSGPVAALSDTIDPEVRVTIGHVYGGPRE